MAFDTSGLVAYVNGEYVDLAQASVSIFDHGFLYGDGVFEGMRVFDGGLFRAHDHMARLARSARTIGLKLPAGADELIDIIGEVVRRSDLRDAHVRPIITRGFGGPGIDPRLCPDPGLVVSAYPFPPFLGKDPIKLFTSAIVRKAPRSLGAHVKSLNYLDAIVAKQQAGELGMHDAVMLDSLGAVAECTGANLFIVVGDDAGDADDSRRAAGDHAPDGARDRRRGRDRGGRARRLADGAALRRRRLRLRLRRRCRADRLLRRAPGHAARASDHQAHPGRLPRPNPARRLPDRALHWRVMRLFVTALTLFALVAPQAAQATSERVSTLAKRDALIHGIAGDERYVFVTEPGLGIATDGPRVVVLDRDSGPPGGRSAGPAGRRVQAPVHP